MPAHPFSKTILTSSFPQKKRWALVQPLDTHSTGAESIFPAHDARGAQQIHDKLDHRMGWFFSSSSSSRTTPPSGMAPGPTPSSTSLLPPSTRRTTTTTTTEGGRERRNSYQTASAPPLLAEGGFPMPPPPSPSLPQLHISEEYGECAVCFDPLCMQQTGVFVANVRGHRSRRRTCQHFFHLRCAMSIAEHNLTCPVCRAPFTAVLPVPSPRDDPSGWFRAVDVDGDGR